MKIIILDTETSGSSPEDRIISLALAELCDEKLSDIQSGFFNPGVPIKQGAYWVHHISDEQVAGKPFFKDSPLYKIVKDIFSDHTNIIIGHAICNDLFMFAKEGLRCKCRIIDTQYCSVKILKKSKTSLFHLQNELNLAQDISEKIILHTADGDVMITYYLLLELLKHCNLKKLIETTMDIFYEYRFVEYKHKKRKIYQIAGNDKTKLERHFIEVKDPKAYYALMYFYENADMFKDTVKKSQIIKILNTYDYV